MKRVILNVVKHLKSLCGCTPILRFAQDDTSFMLRVVWVALFICLSLSVHAQTPFRVVFWNVENLFDTKDNPRKNDNEFLPDAHRHWTPFRYNEKQKKIAKTLIACGDGQLPSLVGLCEVENDSCLYHLTRRTPLREAGYRYVVTDSPDQRGIDVALLYQESMFRPIARRDIRIPHKQVKRGPTRDILHVAGRVASGDTLDVFVCHMPSRSGGQAKSEPYRIFTAQVLKQAVDSVMRIRKHPSVVVMGDFNDYPTDRSIRKVLCADGKLMNLMTHLPDGTYFYRGAWGMLDQFMVSQAMLRKRARIRTSAEKVSVFRPDFLLEKNARTRRPKPFRTYNGMRYLGGYSDHLPIVMDLELTRGDKDYYSGW